jgi:N-methylhydantoinase B
MIESRYPLRLERYTLNPASAGPGRFRGGMGTIKEYVILEDGLFSQISVEGTRHPAWGLDGGGDAQPSHVILYPGTPEEQVVMDKVGFVGPFRAGDVVSVRTGGGGGWGDPLEREPTAVAEDVANGLLSVEAARERYGVAVGVDGAIDHEETRRLRSTAMRQET